MKLCVNNLGRHKGFTLTELLILVIMISIIGNALIPKLRQMELQAMRSEIPVNLKAIRTVEIAYRNDFGVFVSAMAYPSSPSAMPQDWVKPSSGGFATMGWEPEGAVRGSYAVSTTAVDFTAYGLSDVDGDGTQATFIATSVTKPTLTTDVNVY